MFFISGAYCCLFYSTSLEILKTLLQTERVRVSKEIIEYCNKNCINNHELRIQLNNAPNGGLARSPCEAGDAGRLGILAGRVLGRSALSRTRSRGASPSVSTLTISTQPKPARVSILPLSDPNATHTFEQGH